VSFITNEWDKFINRDKIKSVFKAVESERKKGKVILPKKEHIFRCFTEVGSPKEVKVVILGQDPYPDPIFPDGLAFSTLHPFITPKSLNNIFKEITRDVIKEGEDIPLNTDLTVWVKQGVLLLNSTLTVEAMKPGSHSNIGWQGITDEIIRNLSACRNNLVFILWGEQAQTKEFLISPEKHLILKSPHPSPLSAYRGFSGCSHFSKTNEYLSFHKMKEINWRT